MKNVFIISTSLRPNSNSRRLALEFKKGAEENNNVVFYDAQKLNIKFCIGCLSCVKNKKCVLNDDMQKIYDQFSNSDVIVFASPIYYYEVSGWLKTFIDRLNPLYSRKNKFKEIYAIFTAAEDEGKDTYQKAEQAIQGWVDCFDEVNIKKVIFGGGVNSPKDIEEKTDVLKEAYEAGKNL